MIENKQQNSTRKPHENIMCKDCAHRCGDYKSLTCNKFQEKPYLIYEEGKRCPYYGKKISGLSLDDWITIILAIISGIVYIVSSYISRDFSANWATGILFGAIVFSACKSIAKMLVPKKFVIGYILGSIMAVTIMLLSLYRVDTALAIVMTCSGVVYSLVSVIYTLKIKPASKKATTISSSDFVTESESSAKNEKYTDDQTNSSEEIPNTLKSQDFTLMLGYEGDTKDGKFHGFGTYSYPNGNKYEGEWMDGNRHGKGTIHYLNGDKYVGDWVNGNKHGQGTYYYNNGDKYIGEWVDGNRHGQGTYSYNNGDRYEGAWTYGNKHGKGIEFYADGAKYEGEWADDEKHGSGLWYMPGVGTVEYHYAHGEIIKQEDNYGVSQDKYVFISYSTKNQEKADAMRNLLHDEKVKTWMAPYDIPAGSKYAHVISDAIENCACVLLLLSEYSQSSEWVDKEVERAVTNKKTIIAMHLDESQLNSGFKFYLGNEQIVPVNMIDRNDSSVQKVVKAIKTFLT